MFQLNTIQELYAEKSMPCDATALLFDFIRAVDIKTKEKHIVQIFNQRSNKIEPHEQYLHIEVIDLETSELLEFNCTKHQHTYNLINSIYPYLLTILFL